MIATIRPARTADVESLRRLIDAYSPAGLLLGKTTVALYEDVQEFVVAEVDGRVIGAGALHVLWQDLAEVRTLAVEPCRAGQGIGSAVLERLVERARELGVSRLFALTFQVSFFRRHGFRVIEGSPVGPEVYAELVQSYDEGVAEFLDLARVKPNTLGNSRMLLDLT